MKRIVAIFLVALGLLAAACSSPGTPQSQMKSWISSTGYGPSTGTLLNDAKKSAQVVASNQGTNANHTVCAVMLLDAQNANNNLPTPDTTASNLLAKAYGALGSAANDCYDAYNNPAKVAAFSAQRLLGLQYLAEAQARIEAVVGGVVSTSTTSDNGSLAQ